MKTIRLLYLIIIVSLMAVSAQATPLNFTDFTRSTSVTLTGSSAELSEDSTSSPVYMRDEFTTNGVLSFDYDLQVAEHNEDYFDFYLGNDSIPLFSEGGTQGIYKGHLQYDLSNFIASEVSVIFALSSGWEDSLYNSCLTISNAVINPSPVPEPTTMFLFVSGLGGIIAGLGRKRKT